MLHVTRVTPLPTEPPSVVAIKEAGKGVVLSYIIEGDAFHGFVLPQGVHLVQVAVSDEHRPVLCLVEMVDLENTKHLISHPAGYGKCTPTSKYPAGDMVQSRNSYSFVQTDTRCDCVAGAERDDVEKLLPFVRCRRTELS